MVETSLKDYVKLNTTEKNRSFQIYIYDWAKFNIRMLIIIFFKNISLKNEFYKNKRA